MATSRIQSTVATPDHTRPVTKARAPLMVLAMVLAFSHF